MIPKAASFVSSDGVIPPHVEWQEWTEASKSGSLTMLPINMNMTGRYPLRLARARLDADIPMSYT